MKSPTDTELTNIFAYIEVYPDHFRWHVVDCGEVEYCEGQRPRLKTHEYRICTQSADGYSENLSEPFPSYMEAQAEADRRNGGSVAEHMARLSQTKTGGANA
jgi:hypothetical protein